MAMKGAASIRKKTETTAKFSTRNSAEWTALRLKSMPRAAPTDTPANIKKTTSSGVIAMGLLGVLHLGDRAVELARLHLLRGRRAAGRHGHDQHFLGIDGRVAVGVRQLVIALQHDRLGGAG